MWIFIIFVIGIFEKKYKLINLFILLFRELFWEKYLRMMWWYFNLSWFINLWSFFGGIFLIKFMGFFL